MSEPIWSDCQINEFNSVVEPVIRWINDSGNPHMKAIISSTNAELVSGEICHNTEMYLLD
jgi:hypothetical protein